MIYTLTLNPSLDYVVSLPELELGAVNRLTAATTLPGGKGINVSRILHTLNYSTVALGFAGGATGNQLQDLLRNHQLPTAFTPIQAATRINVKLRAQQETELNAPGPMVTEAEIARFKQDLFNRLQPGDVVIMAGSLPPTLPEHFYLDLVDAIKAHQADFVIDTTGEALLLTLAKHPLVVKPNHHELAELFGDAPYQSLDQIAAAGKRLLALGAKHVLVSMAGAGALMVTKDAVYHGQVTAQPVKNSVGAGDSMLAGFTGTLLATHDALAAFKISLACGSGTAFSTDLATAATITAVHQTVTVQPL